MDILTVLIGTAVLLFFILIILIILLITSRPSSDEGPVYTSSSQDVDLIKDQVNQPVKRRRGRPRKNA